MKIEPNKQKKYNKEVEKNIKKGYSIKEAMDKALKTQIRREMQMSV